MNNPRFPHTVTVTREKNTGTSFEPVIVTETIFYSKCRNFITLKGYGGFGVNHSNYTISLPLHSTSILTGDKVSVVDSVRTITGEVVSAQIGNIGANIYYNEVKN